MHTAVAQLLLPGKLHLAYLSLKYINSETERHQQTGGNTKMSAQEYLELSKLYSPSLSTRITENVYQAVGTSDTATLAVKSLSTEAVAESYAELTAALIGCPDLQACALVKNHADLLFMENQNHRSSKLGGSKFDVIAHESFSLAFEGSLIKAS